MEKIAEKRRLSDETAPPLIRNKRASGRAHELADAERMEKGVMPSGN